MLPDKNWDERGLPLQVFTHTRRIVSESLRKSDFFNYSKKYEFVWKSVVAVWRLWVWEWLSQLQNWNKKPNTRDEEIIFFGIGNRLGMELTIQLWILNGCVKVHAVGFSIYSRWRGEALDHPRRNVTISSEIICRKMKRKLPRGGARTRIHAVRYPCQKG